MPGEPALARDGLRCAVCGSAGPFELYLDILLRCQQCSLVFADPQLTHEQVEQLYGRSYFSGEEYADYIADKNTLQRSFRQKIAYIGSTAPEARRVFEIGAAYGFFLELARERWEAAGIDIAADATAYARRTPGANVQCGDFLTADIPARYYDVFCMWDTIEHLARPDAYIARVAELITRGGYIFISTGDIDSAVARRQGRRWRLIHPPTHLFYFSRTTLSRLLARYGFRVRGIITMAQHRSLRQTVYSLFVQRHPRSLPLYERFAATPLGGLSYPLDLGDIMVIAAQAPGVSIEPG